MDNYIYFYTLIVYIPLLVFFHTAVINFLTAPKLKSGKKPFVNKTLTVAIPARNEASNIKRNLEHLINQSYHINEILVLDDNSEDETYTLAKEYEAKYSNIKVIKGIELPSDWLGKNWACKILGDNAQSEYILFIDADTFLAKDAVSSAMALVETYKLDFLSAFPRQAAKSFFAKLLLPLVDLIAYSGFIFISAYYIRNKVFVAAIGQFMLFKKDIYHKIGGHESLKNEVVEDVNLARRVKEFGGRTMTANGSQMIVAEMYNSFGEIWRGFEKNLFGISKSMILFFIILFVLINSLFAPFVLVFMPNFTELMLPAVVLILLWRLMMIANLRHSFVALFFHPIAILIYFAMAINSLIKVKQKKIKWKGRDIISNK